MSLSNLYSTARRGLLASQAATNATGNNIANAETAGYTRRAVNLRPGAPTPGGLFISSAPSSGGGVNVEGFGRVRGQLLDLAVRNSRTASGGAGEGAQLLSSLEATLAPDGGEAFLGAIGGFFDAWSDVADAPTDPGVRDALLAAGETLTRTFQNADRQLQAYGEGVQDSLVGTVDEINTVLSEVADLNVIIRTARSQGGDDLDALDRRDLLLDQLSGLAPVSIRPNENGTVTVAINGMVGVQDGEARPLRVELPPAVSEPAVYANGSSRPFTFDATQDGVLGAQLNLLTSALPAARDALDAIAADLVARVNDAHVGGTGLDGATGRTFFDPAGTTARTFALSADLTSADAIAAGTGGPGDSSVATAIAGFGEEATGAGTKILSGIGARARSAIASAEANDAFSAHAEALRDGVSKVSLDEEMTNLIRFQQSYAASARVLQTAESLFDTLLSL